MAMKRMQQTNKGGLLNVVSFDNPGERDLFVMIHIPDKKKAVKTSYINEVGEDCYIVSFYGGWSRNLDGSIKKRELKPKNEKIIDNKNIQNSIEDKYRHTDPVTGEEYPF